MNAFRQLVTVLLSLSVLASVAFAFDAQLSQQEVQEAVQAGRQLVSPSSGYKVQDWVLYDVKDPYAIQPGQGDVEAVIVGTPFERLRYQSYLQAYQNKTFSADEAQQKATDLADTVTFVVFAHSQGASEQYRDFLDGFSGAQLQVSGQTLQPAQVETFGPAQDFYNVAGKAAEFRFLGTANFRFDLSGFGDNPGTLQGTFSFTAPSGKPYSFDVDLSNFR